MGIFNQITFFFQTDQSPPTVMEVDPQEEDITMAKTQLSLSESPNEKKAASLKASSEEKSPEPKKDGGINVDSEEPSLLHSAEKIKPHKNAELGGSTSIGDQGNNREEPKESDGNSKSVEPKKKRIQFTTLSLINK